MRSLDLCQHLHILRDTVLNEDLKVLVDVLRALSLNGNGKRDLLVGRQHQVILLQLHSVLLLRDIGFVEYQRLVTAVIAL